MTKRIDKVEFRKEPDDHPDLSYLGEYASTPGPNAIDRKARGDMGRGEYCYFNVAMSGHEPGNAASVEEDYHRAEAYCRGEWGMCFCQAVATVVVVGLVQHVRSGGLGGVESDSDDSYFEEIEREELNALKAILTDRGFDPAEVEMKCNPENVTHDD